MESINSERSKIFTLAASNIDGFSVYNIKLNYTSELTYYATARLVSDGVIISQFLPDLIFVPGNNSMSFNIVTSFYRESKNKPVQLVIISKEPMGFLKGLELSYAVLSDKEKYKSLQIEENSLRFDKIFDLRLQFSQVRYLTNTLLTGKKSKDTPIIIHGFYNREDGLGAHLPNIVENVLYDYKYLSFSRQLNRGNDHFSFLNRESNAPSLSEIKYDKDFQWMHYYFSNENNHLSRPDQYQNSVFLHVGGIGLSAQEIWEDIKLFKYMRETYSSKICLYLMWESNDIEVIRELLEATDIVIVTNSWLKALLTSKLPNKEIVQVEHIAKYYIKPSNPGESFVFGYSGGLWPRKNVLMAIEAFKEMSCATDTLKIHSRAFVNTPMMLNPIIAATTGVPNIELRNETLNDADYADWWKSLNCYVFISNGESYSITPRQALMQGTPCILSKNTSHLDLLDIPGILWVDTDNEIKAKFSGDPDAVVNIGNEFSPNKSQVISRLIEAKEKYATLKEQALLGGEILKKRTDKENIKTQWDLILDAKR